MKVNKRSKKAISDVISAILMLAIAVSLLSVVYFSFQNFSLSQPPLSADIVGYVDGNNVIIEHHGGESLNLDTQVILRIGDTLYNLTLGDYLDSDAISNGLWDFGEKFVYPVGDIPGYQVKVSVTDADRSYMLLSGIIQEGDVIPYLEVNFAPEISSPNPANSSIDINILPQLSIDVSDDNSDTMNISWFSNSSGSWELFGNNLSIGDGVYYQNNSNFSGYSTKYWWKVNLSDGNGGFDEEIYFFTTESIGTIDTSIDNISPYSTSTDPFTINATSSGDTPDNITLYYRWSSDNWSNDLVTIYESGFESGEDLDDWILDTTRTTAGSGYTLELDDDGTIGPRTGSNYLGGTGNFDPNYAAYNKTIDITNYTNVSVSVWYSFEDTEDDDEFGFYWWNESSTSWITIFEDLTPNNGNQEPWTNANIDIPDNIDSLILQFWWSTSSTSEHVMIDDLSITGNLSKTYKWNIWNNVNNPDTDSPWSWSFDFPNSTGYYEFYSIGNKSGLIDELAPSSADARCNYTLVPLDTSINIIDPYDTSSNPLTISATSSGSNPYNVTLYYRWSDDNSTWEDSDLNNTVEDNTSDIDSNSDTGVESNFNNAQDVIPDSDFMNIVEENTGDEAGSEWLNCNTYDSTDTAWTRVGYSPYLDSQNQPTDYVYSNTNNNEIGWFDFEDTSLTGTLTVNISVYCNNDDGPNNDRAEVFVDYTGSGSGTEVGDVAMHTAWQYDTISLGTHTVEEVNNLRVFFKYDQDSQPDEVRIDHVRIGVSSSPSTNYEIDFEYNWSNADFNKENEEICIYVDSHTGSEDLNVNYWSGSTWTSLGSITSTGWTNLTATGLTSSNYTIQLIGSDESSDSSQDEWDIDVIKFHTWNTTTGTGFNWSLWSDASNPDTSSPWSWNFNFPNSTGYYEFYSIGKKSGLSDETTPIAADARCYYNPS